ncbi:hypothetical protein ACFX13_020454 [Malus domestica]
MGPGATGVYPMLRNYEPLVCPERPHNVYKAFTPKQSGGSSSRDSLSKNLIKNPRTKPPFPLAGNLAHPKRRRTNDTRNPRYIRRD